MKTNNNFHILIIDDEKLNIELASIYLKEEDYRISFALSAKSAFEILSTKKIDLILLDINMPQMDGFEMCKILKGEENSKDIPIIFLTAQTGIEYISNAFNVGGVDYISKPFNGVELKARVKTQLQNLSYFQEIKHKQSKLAQLSITDNLTKLKNGLYFDSQIKQFQKEGEGFWLIYIKVERLEKINEIYGFFMANKMLRRFAKILEKTLFANSVIARIYGGAFGILIKNYDKNTISNLYSKIQKELSSDKDIGKIITTYTILYHIDEHFLTTPEIYKNIYSKLVLLKDTNGSSYSFI